MNLHLAKLFVIECLILSGLASAQIAKSDPRGELSFLDDSADAARNCMVWRCKSSGDCLSHGCHPVCGLVSKGRCADR